MTEAKIVKLIDEILPCIESHAEGRNATTRLRRGVMVMFFHHCACMNSPTCVAPLVAVDQLVTQLMHSSQAQQQWLQGARKLDQVPVDIRTSVRAIGDILEEAVDVVTRLLEQGDDAGAGMAASAALGQVFDWNEPAHLQAYVYLVTGEMLDQGLLGKERTLLKHALGKCLEEVSHDDQQRSRNR